MSTPDPSGMPRITAWLRPALALCMLAPVGAAIAWAVTRWQISGDDNCGPTATHASCGLSAAGAAAAVAVSALVAALLTLAPALARADRRSSWSRLGWAVVATWIIGAGVYVALPPSG